jgi:hypothetical protein
MAMAMTMKSMVKPTIMVRKNVFMHTSLMIDFAVAD